MSTKVFNLGDENCPIAEKLGNFFATPFVIDGVKCGSAEGFIQALKFRDLEKQRQVAALVGKEAKFKGKKAGKRIAREGTVFWCGLDFQFGSKEHLELIERGIRAKFEQSEECRKALLETGNAQLVHETGRAKSRFTSLPAREFIRIVSTIRDELQVFNGVK